MQAFLYKQRPYLWLANDDSVDAVSKSSAGFQNGAPAGALQRAEQVQSLTQVHQK